MQEKSGTPASSLWIAAHIGDAAAVRRLLDDGVDVNVWDKYGRTALTLAINAGHVELARLLVESGAWVDPFEDDSVYMTPLMCAANRGDVSLVEYLLDHGADPLKRGGPSFVTAEYYARVESKNGYLAAILRLAEDRLRESRRK
jgi:ankyrin repeat protein